MSHFQMHSGNNCEFLDINFKNKHEKYCFIYLKLRKKYQNDGITYFNNFTF